MTFGLGRLEKAAIVIGTYLDFDIGPADFVHRRFLQICLIEGVIRLNHLICVIDAVFVRFLLLLVLDTLKAPRRVIFI